MPYVLISNIDSRLHEEICSAMIFQQFSNREPIKET